MIPGKRNVLGVFKSHREASEPGWKAADHLKALGIQPKFEAVVQAGFGSDLDRIFRLPFSSDERAATFVFISGVDLEVEVGDDVAADADVRNTLVGGEECSHLYLGPS